jgi:hypothetical protein
MQSSVGRDINNIESRVAESDQTDVAYNGNVQLPKLLKMMGREPIYTGYLTSCGGSEIVANTPVHA